MAFNRKEQCNRCGLKGGTRVPPSGNIDSPSIAFVRGMPTQESSDTGRAFSGQEGTILRQILTKAGADLENVMYTYACPCQRVESDEPPELKDISACVMRMRHELRESGAKIIVPMGKIALIATTGKEAYTKERGIYRKVDDLAIIPTLDPSNLYTDPEQYLDLVKDINYIVDVAINGADPVIEPPFKQYHFADTQEKFEKFLAYMKKRKPKRMSVDIETTGLDFQFDFILCISFSIDREIVMIVDWANLIEGNAKNGKRLAALLAGIDCGFHNGQFDDLFLRFQGKPSRYTYDTMLAHYALDERQGSHSLKQVAREKYRASQYDLEIAAKVRSRRTFVQDNTIPPYTLDDWADPVSRNLIAGYNGADADYTFRLMQDLEVEMKKDSVGHLPADILVPAAKHFTQMKLDGMLVDTEYHDALGKKWGDEVIELEKEMRQFKGAEYINLGSVPQIKHFIFDVLDLKPMMGALDQVIDQDDLLAEIEAIEDAEAQEFWHTASSAIFTKMKPQSTSTFMLYWLASQHPFPRLLVKHRLASKKFGTYYEGVKNVMGQDLRIRPDYKIHGTRTGRLSSTNPNIHGTPRRDEIKRMYVADPGFIIVGADYSQAEIRMMAHFAGDRTLIQALHEQDIHREIAKRLFGLTEAQMSALSDEEQKIKRRAAKTIAFGLIYGRGAKSLAPQMGVTLNEAKDFIEKYFLMMPNVGSWIARQGNLVMQNREVVSLYGRKRRFPLMLAQDAKAKAKRQAVNFPIQSSVSDMTLRANMDIIEILKRRGIPTKVGFHIHDGFLFQVPESYAKVAIDVTRDRMSDVGFKTEVPFIADVETGRTWGDMHKAA